jgi:hypothetical protein|tara:strand:+ start:1902 stop:2240 length:339 start_codon:yes stop_codon:yes gene_type:complete
VVYKWLKENLKILYQDLNLEKDQEGIKKDFQNPKKDRIRNIIDKGDNMSDIPEIPAEAKEIIKHKRTGKIYASKEEFDADVADPQTDTTHDDFRQDLEIKVTKIPLGIETKK